MRYQRHHRGPWTSLQRSRRSRASPPPRQRFSKDKSSSTALRQHTKPGSTDTPRPSSGDRPALPFTASPKASKSNAARNRAIQKKQEQIEEVYRQDCDTFGMVVKMLVTKDPSLEKLIQLSLHENLRDIGMRCVEAMERFIQEYDSREIHTPSTSQTPSIK